MLNKLIDEAQQLNCNIYSIGEYAENKYSSFDLQKCNLKKNVYSVSKSVTSMILFTVMEKYNISLDEKIYKFFPDVKKSERWDEVTLCDLLNHTTGIKYGIIDIDNTDMQPQSMDFLSEIFSTEIVYSPGTRMVYSDSNYYLVSRIISKVTGKCLYDVAREKLFNPLGIIGAAWATCPYGFSMGATGLFLSIDDMLKIGTVMMNKGKYCNKKIIPSALFEYSEKRAVHTKETVNYGLGFWRSTVSNVFWADGMLGQLIVALPDQERVVALQSCTDSSKHYRLLDMLLDNKL